MPKSMLPVIALFLTACGWAPVSTPRPRIWPARQLPPERVFRVEGGHRWPVWRELRECIAAADFPRMNRP